ncbi:MAG: methionyl-tRNA formyltransferase [Calditrichaceae bacterium]
MKIVFMGTPDFAVVSLKKLIANNHQIVAVVTVPDKPKGRGLKVIGSPVKQLALENDLEILQPKKLKNEDFIRRLKQIEADVYVVVAFRILPPEVFNIPKLGTINLHASLLPKYRGAAPINWTIINGEKQTGVTTILIDEKVDTGNMLIQKKVNISDEMTAGELHDVLAEHGANVLLKTLDKLSSGTLKIEKQDNSQATKAPKLDKELCHVNFNQPAKDVYNLIRGLNPYPAAFVYHKEKQIKIFNCTVAEINKSDDIPGTVIDKSKTDFTIACAEGSIAIKEVQLQGKRRMWVKDFFNGYNIEKGDLLK